MKMSVGTELTEVATTARRKSSARRG